jgi:hypothetical protein
LFLCPIIASVIALKVGTNMMQAESNEKQAKQMRIG